jgi:hypothetical protein
MADAKVGVIIEAEDKASDVIKGVSQSAGNLEARMKSMKPAFQAMAVAGTVAFGAVAGAIYKSIESAAEAQKVQAQLGAVLKSTGGVAGVTAQKALDLSQALQKTTTFSDEAVLSAEIFY